MPQIAQSKSQQTHSSLGETSKLNESLFQKGRKVEALHPLSPRGPKTHTSSVEDLGPLYQSPSPEQSHLPIHKRADAASEPITNPLNPQRPQRPECEPRRSHPPAPPSARPSNGVSPSRPHRGNPTCHPHRRPPSPHTRGNSSAQHNGSPHRQAQRIENPPAIRVGAVEGRGLLWK